MQKPDKSKNSLKKKIPARRCISLKPPETSFKFVPTIHPKLKLDNPSPLLLVKSAILEAKEGNYSDEESNDFIQKYKTGSMHFNNDLNAVEKQRSSSQKNNKKSPLANNNIEISQFSLEPSITNHVCQSTKEVPKFVYKKKNSILSKLTKKRKYTMD